MFIYMSKKIAIPKQSNVNCLAWNHSSGYIAVGGEDGMLKVLKLESGGAGNLSMNLSLEGHSGQLRMAVWNEVYQKLTTSDEHGVIIVWMLYKGSWYEEMINNRNKSTVTGMAWGSDGQKICIAYEDGAVIVGSVDGLRVWGKDIKGPGLSAVQWSPDNTQLLFALSSGELQLYDDQGNFTMAVTSHAASAGEVVALRWFPGRAPPARPVLAVCHRTGLLQLMKNCIDDDVVVVDTHMTALDCHWNHNGAILAVAGTTADNNNVIQFFSAYGEHIRTLRVPGGNMRAISWEGRSLRIAIAIESFIYFANVKPDHKYAFYGNTLAFCSGPETVTFWDTTTHQSWINTIPEVVDMSGVDEYCVIATLNSLIISNQQGIQCDAKTVTMPISYTAINSKYTVVAASKDAFLVWKFSTPSRTRSTEQLFHADGSPATSDAGIRDDGIACIASSDSHLLVGRDSGTILLFSLVNMRKITSINLNAKPYKLGLNCNSSKFFVIDQAGSLYILDTDMANNISVGQALRKDVWGARWAGDDPRALAAAEKARLYVLRGAEPEEPLPVQGYLCRFQDLEITMALLDNITDKCTPQHVARVDVKSLRDTRQLLEQVGLREAEAFIKDNPHPRLWLLLAEAALKNFEAEGALETAEAAFVRRTDYAGIKFVGRLNALHSNALKKAEIMAYFKDFDAAEKIYHDEDRRDLAIALRKRLGHWFRVVELLKTSATTTDKQVKEAYSNIGDYYIDRQNWSGAIEYYTMCDNVEGLRKCYMALEDNEALAKLAGSPRHNKESFAKSNPAVDEIIDVDQTPSVQLLMQLKESGRMLQTAAMAYQLATMEASQKASPIRIKKLYILAAHIYNQSSVDGAKNREAARCYRLGAAQHWLALAMARAYAQPFRAEAALRAAARLMTVIDDLHSAQHEQVWCTVALIAIEARAFSLCSKAFIKLEALDVDNQYENLAVEVFTRYKPRDPKGTKVNCPNCETGIPDWATSCDSCGSVFPGCAVTARPLGETVAWRCGQCRHHAARHDLVLRHSCPMCHAALA
ncbi:unnamed protein product [Plutella xylostella]|uniref:(diamondback moth) hypothetical protein n=1 Tax=Plutella xylostella TaxID=51655 RepID=A0A8S4DIN0_PLUXY|nr:unnamed protein product [Plutella xylostella]